MKYKIGYGDPSLFRDVGSGVWNSEPATLKAKAQRLFILGNIGNADSEGVRDERVISRLCRMAARHLANRYRPYKSANGRHRKSDRTMMNREGGWHSACRTCGLLWSQLLNHDSTRFLIAAR
jgi:hypothetical protein